MKQLRFVVMTITLVCVAFFLATTLGPESAEAHHKCGHKGVVCEEPPPPPPPPPPPAEGSVAIEAENMTLSGAAYKGDRADDSGTSVYMTAANAKATDARNYADKISNITVKAGPYTEPSGSSIVMRVLVDGQVKMEKTLTYSTWSLADYSQTVDIPSGSHEIAVVFASATGNYNELWVDKVTVGAGSGSTEPPPPTGGTPTVALGAFTPGNGGLWDDGSLNATNTAAGRQIEYLSWHYGMDPYGYPVEASTNRYNQGYEQVMTWNPVKDSGTPGQAAYSHDAYLRGDHDAMIRSYARQVKGLGFPINIRMGHEMNGDWFNWGDTGLNGNTPEKFAEMFRRYVNIFRQEGATNAKWVWCPNIDPFGQYKPLSRFYPGDDYVDWLCLDGYNFAETHGLRSMHFDELFSKSYAEITALAPSKPVMIDEYASHETNQSPSKAEWIDQMRVDVPAKYPKIKAMSWFHATDIGSWKIDTSIASRDAYRRLTADTYYQGAAP